MIEQELTYRELDEHFRGKPPNKLYEFSTGYQIDHEASLAQGKTVKRPVTMICIYYKGLTDRVSRPATQQQIQDHPAEYAEYLEQIRRGNQDEVVDRDAQREPVRGDSDRREHHRITVGEAIGIAQSR
jgi:hypothetical protein